MKSTFKSLQPYLIDFHPTRFTFSSFPIPRKRRLPFEIVLFCYYFSVISWVLLGEIRFWNFRKTFRNLPDRILLDPNTENPYFLFWLPTFLSSIFLESWNIPYFFRGLEYSNFSNFMKNLRFSGSGVGPSKFSWLVLTLLVPNAVDWGSEENQAGDQDQSDPSLHARGW